MTIPSIIIELTVNNHAGVMSHITGLFSRRGYNLEAILCAPVNGGETSKMYLLINRENNIDQIIKQLEKLYDVKSVTKREDADHRVFDRIEELLVKV